MSSTDQPMDHVPPEMGNTGDSDSKQFEKNVKERSTWLRLFFMLVFGFLYALSRLVMFAVVGIQFFHVLFTAETNEQLKSFGQSLAIYSYQLVRYLTFNTERKPFPLEQPWPDANLNLGDL